MWQFKNTISLQELITIPDTLATHLYKCRVTYGETIHRIEWEPYVRRDIQTLKAIQADRINYQYKYTDRHDLNYLYNQRDACDDILILVNGFVTDTFVCNLAFYDGSAWYTPDTPLLQGTQRALLLDQEMIREKTIRTEHLAAYSHVKLFNAMVPWAEATELEVSRILT